MNTESTESLYTLAHRLLGQQNHRDAATVFRLMLHVAPRDERSWLGLGLCHERNNQDHIAKQLYAIGSDAARPSPKCLLACARVMRRLQLEDQASNAYEQAIELGHEVDQLEIAALAQHELETEQ